MNADNIATNCGGFTDMILSLLRRNFRLGERNEWQKHCAYEKAKLGYFAHTLLLIRGKQNLATTVLLKLPWENKYCVVSVGQCIRLGFNGYGKSSVHKVVGNTVLALAAALLCLFQVVSIVFGFHDDDPGPV